MDNNLKKSDESKVKVFIQGSADITGQNSFSGKLNEQYPFDKNQRIAPKLLPRPGCKLNTVFAATRSKNTLQLLQVMDHVGRLHLWLYL